MAYVKNIYPTEIKVYVFVYPHTLRYICDNLHE